MASAMNAHDAQAKIRWATDRFLSVLDRVSNTQWQHCPPPGQWSMSEVTEHVAVTTEGRREAFLLSERLYPRSCLPPFPIYNHDLLLLTRGERQTVE